MIGVKSMPNLLRHQYGTLSHIHSNFVNKEAVIFTSFLEGDQSVGPIQLPVTLR